MNEKMNLFLATTALFVTVIITSCSAYEEKTLRNVGLDQCIGFGGTRATFVECDSSLAAKFEFDDVFRLHIMSGSQAGKCLRGWTDDKVFAESCSGGHSQKWYPIRVAGEKETYKFMNVYANRYDLEGPYSFLGGSWQVMMEKDEQFYGPDPDHQWFKGLGKNFFQ